MGKNIIKFLDKAQENNYLSTNVFNTEHIVYRTELDNGYFVGYDNNKLELNQIPLTFKINGTGQVTWKYVEKNGVSLPKTIEYRINGGSWISLTSTSVGVGFGVKKGDIVQFRGNNSNYAVSSGSYVPYNNLICSADHDIYGNFMSLVDGENFENITTSDVQYAFAYFFAEDSHVINAKDLILPIKSVVDNAYNAMFIGCTKLKTAPKLPATNVGWGGYSSMFSNCTSLTEAPSLPATTTSNYAYAYMFQSCTSLKVAPYIGMTTINGVMYMFDRCTKLNYMRVLGTQGTTSFWTNNVASTGTFIKCAGDTWTTGTSGIPTGWTVYSEISKDCDAGKIRNYLASQTTLQVKDVGQCTVTETVNGYNYQYDIRKSSDDSLVATLKIKNYSTWVEVPTEPILIEESVQ